MPVLEHVHTYERFRKPAGVPLTHPRITYRCTDPHCHHYLTRDALIGKAALCPLCRREFVLTTIDLKMKSPKCLYCRNTKEGRQFRAAEALLADFEASLKKDEPMQAEPESDIEDIAKEPF